MRFVFVLPICIVLVLVLVLVVCVQFGSNYSFYLLSLISSLGSTICGAPPMLLLLCTYFLQFSMTKERPSENAENRTKFCREP